MGRRRVIRIERDEERLQNSGFGNEQVSGPFEERQVVMKLRGGRQVMGTKGFTIGDFINYI